MTTPRLASIVLCLCAGCGLMRSPDATPTKFYVLTAAAQPGEVAGRRLMLGIGPVSFPSYLERPEMVRRVEANQLKFDEFERWAEPLKDNFVHVVATDLDRLVGLERVVFYPWYRDTTMDYSVSITVLRFEAQPAGDAALDARWSIGDGHGNVLVNRDAHLSRPGGSSAQTAAALSDLTADLCREIATALRELDATRKK